ncbi:hypothetical protein B0H13DRAFT_1909579 [Mycena leptocephala]|nr:hypothetical protein B0H13DRAFT_1909579 [Mycena leptocephala]
MYAQLTRSELAQDWWPTLPVLDTVAGESCTHTLTLELVQDRQPPLPVLACEVEQHFWWDSEAAKVMAKGGKGWQRVAKVQEITLFAMHRLIIQSQGFPVEAGAAKVVKVQTECLPVDPIHHIGVCAGRPIIRDDRGYRGCIQSVWAGSKCKRAWSRWRVAPLDGPLLRLLCTLRALLSWLGSVFVAEDHFGGGRKKLRMSRDFGPIWNGFVKEAQPFTKAYPS